MKTVIHVNQHIIKSNRNLKRKKAPLTAKFYKENKKGKSILIDGPVKIIYSPDKPLKCGATCWIETDSKSILKIK